MVYELTTRFDARKSFYGKAQVEDTTEGVFLYSYNRNVAKIIGGQLILCPDWNYSQTTRRHVKEFCKQYDVEEQYNELRRG
jgi:hypothetical protein